MENNMSIKDAFIAFWTKGFTFTGRARRREVWLNILATIIIGLILTIVVLLLEIMTGGRYHVMDHYGFVAGTIFPYITTIPTMAQASRRLHDINMSGKIAIVITVLSAILSFITEQMTGTFPVNLDTISLPIILITLFTVLGGLFLFIINFIKGNEGDNKYGKDPKRV